MFHHASIEWLLITSFLAFIVKSNQIIIRYMLHNCKFSYVQNDTITNQTFPCYTQIQPLSNFTACQMEKKRKKKVSSLP